MNMHDVAVFVKCPKSSGESFVAIKCEETMGLNFHNTKNIILEGIRLNGCGALQVSTSKNFSKHISDNEFQFATFNATIYFLYCEGVSLQTVTVTNANGIGAVLYSTVGMNKIESSYFSYIAVLEEPPLPGDGGSYIEFSYCP